MTENGHRSLSGEERKTLRLLVSSTRLQKIREHREEEDRLRREEVERERVRKARRWREKRRARDQGCRCSSCGHLISLSGFEKARAEGRDPLCRPCWDEARTGRRRIPVRRCSFCGVPIENGTYTRAAKAGRSPSCRECRYRRARYDPPSCVDCGKIVSKNHAYQVRKLGKVPRCGKCGQRARRERENAEKQASLVPSG